MKRDRPRAVAFALALLASFLGASSARAFCRTTSCKPEKEDCGRDVHGCARVGAPLGWRAMPIVYRFSASGSSLMLREEARAAVRAAFNRWSDTLCSGKRTSLRLAEGEDILDDKPAVPGARASEAFGIYFRDLGWSYEGKADSTLAQTNLLFGTKTGLIEYADIEVNTGARRFAASDSSSAFDLGAVDLQAVMTHEAGHYLGIAHSDDPASIMAESYCELPEQRCAKGKVAARRLAPDDINALCAIYPPEANGGEAESPGSSSERGCTVTRHGPRGGLALASLLAALVVAGVLRRARCAT